MPRPISPEMPQNMKDAQMMEDDNAPGEDASTPTDEGKTADTVTLDLTEPANEGLKACQEGETLMVKSNDGETIVLEKNYGEDKETPEEDAGESGEEPKGALAILMAKKAK